MANSAKWQVMKARLESTMNIAGQLAKLPGDTLTDLRDSALSAVGTDYASETALSYLSPGGAGSLLSKGWVIDPQKRDVSEPFQKVNQEGRVSPPQRVPTFASNTKEALPVGGGDQVTVGGKKAAGSAASETFDKISNIGNTISEKFGNVSERGIESAQNLYNNATAKAGGAIENKVNDVQNRVQSTIGNGVPMKLNNLDGITNQISSTTVVVVENMRSATTFR
ncbi:hypothetical protein SPFM8_00055 [Salmonella phage SPFM8]|nr:hypothetical protein SPFM8_00055 [Salmonella phage SPFM8]